MKTAAEPREDVLRELAWDPQVIDTDAIAVAFKDEAVTLTGRVPAYAESPAAVRAAGRVAARRLGHRAHDRARADVEDPGPRGTGTGHALMVLGMIVLVRGVRDCWRPVRRSRQR